METAESSAGLTLVTTDDDSWEVAVADLPPRNREIVERVIRMAGPKPSQRDAQDVTSLDRATWRKIRGGEAVAERSYKKAERALADLEEEMGVDTASASTVDAKDFVEYELTIDAIGVRIIGRGTSANSPEVRKQIADLYREIREPRAD